MPIDEQLFEQAVSGLTNQGFSEDEIFAEIENLSDQELDNFSREIVKGLNVPAPEEAPTLIERGEAVARGAAETLTFGQSERAAAAIDATLGEAFELLGLVDKESFANRFQTARAEQEARTEELQEQQPIASAAGEILGFFLPVGAGALAVKAGRAAGRGASSLLREGLGRSAATVLAEGAVGAGTFAAGREGLETLAGEQTLGEAAQQTAVETAAGTAGAGLLTGGGVALSAASKAARKAVKPIVDRLVKRATDNLTPRAADLLENLPKTGNILAKGLGKARRDTDEALGGLVDELNSVKQSLQQQVDDAAADLTPDSILVKAQLDESIDKVSNDLAAGLQEQSVPVELLEENIQQLAVTFNQAKRSLDVAYGKNLDEIVKANKGKAVDLSSAMDEMLLSLENSGVIEGNKVITEAIPNTFKPRERRFIQDHLEAFLNARKSVSFEEANEIKKLAGSLADFSNFDDPARKAYLGIREKLVESDATGRFDKLSKAYAQGRGLADSLKRQTRDTDVTTNLFEKIRRDLEKDFAGTPTVGKAKRLLELKEFEVFSKDEQALIRNVFNQVKRNTEVEKLANPKQLAAKLKRFSQNANKESTQAEIREIEKFVGDIVDIKTVENLGDQQNLPQAIRRVLKEPTNKEAIKQAKELVEKTMPGARAEFQQMINRAAKLDRLKSLPSKKNTLIQQLNDDPELPIEVLQELEIGADLIPEINSLLEEDKIIKLLADKEIMQEVSRVSGLGNPFLQGGALAALAADSEVGFGENVVRLPKTLRVVLGVLAVQRLVSNPAGLALALEKAEVVGSRKAAERAARAISPRMQTIRTKVLPSLVNVTSQRLEGTDG